MTRLLDVALFVLGVYLSIRAIAAIYRVIDLWYTIGTEYPRVIRGLAGWGGATVALLTLLNAPHRWAFVLGLEAYLLFYLSLFVVRRLVLRATAAD